MWPATTGEVTKEQANNLLLLLLLVWHAPLGVRSAKRRHQSPQWTVLSHSYRLIQWEIVRPQSCWIVFIHVVRGRPGGLLQFSEGEAVMILLASVSSGILAMWLNRERRCAWTIADSGWNKNIKLQELYLKFCYILRRIWRASSSSAVGRKLKCLQTFGQQYSANSNGTSCVAH